VKPFGGTQEKELSLPFALAPQIRCCVVLGRDGKRLKITWREGPVTLEPDNDIDLIVQHAAICRKRDQFSSRYHGKTRSLVVTSDRLTLLVFPVADKLVLVTADPDFPLNRTAELGKLLERLYYWMSETHECEVVTDAT
jgi:hypothetical protein